MKIHEIISLEEYIKIPDPGFLPFDMSKGEKIGLIGTSAGPFGVWVFDTEFEIIFGAVKYKPGQDYSDDSQHPVCNLGFLHYGNKLLIAKNAWTEPKYQNKGIATSLMHFINKVQKYKILSDTKLSNQGERLINAMIQSNDFTSKIFDNVTGEIFDFSDIGNTKTTDGVTVISPKDDNKSDKRSDEIKNGQRFFYIFEGIRNATYANNNPNSILQPYKITESNE